MRDRTLSCISSPLFDSLGATRIRPLSFGGVPLLLRWSRSVAGSPCPGMDGWSGWAHPSGGRFVRDGGCAGGSPDQRGGDPPGSRDQSQFIKPNSLPTAAHSVIASEAASPTKAVRKVKF